MAKSKCGPKWRKGFYARKGAGKKVWVKPFQNKARCGKAPKYEHPSAAQKHAQKVFAAVAKHCHKQAPFARKTGAARHAAFTKFKKCERAAAHGR